MLKKTITCLLFIFSLSIIVSAQTSDTERKEKAEKLKADAVSFLRETSAEIANLRTLANRIGFSSELANLMWFHDEKEARVMFNSVTNDFRQMLLQLDAQINTAKTDEENSEISSSSFPGRSNPQLQTYRKISNALGVRMQIATAMSEHDALLAYTFYQDTAAAITNPQLKQQMSQRDDYFEARLLQAVAEQDAAKGLEFGRKSLAKGVTANHLELLKKIYAKDADAGAAFGDEIISKLKSQETESWQRKNLFSGILDLGLDNRKSIKDKPTQKPIFSEQNLRDIAELAAQDFLENQTGNMLPDEDIVGYIEQINPGRGAQLRRKMKSSAAMVSNSNSALSNMMVEGQKPKKADTEKEAFESLQKLEGKKLSAEERAKLIENTNRVIEKISDPKAKMMALTGLAVQISNSGDKRAALLMMKQAETFLSQTPKNYIDYMQLWILASGYAQIEPEKSFPVLESTIYNLNETVAAFIKVGEFIDTDGEMIEDGEVQVSTFGGGLTREFLGALNASNTTLKNLAEADFPRTRNLTNKFDRTEVRILAKMLVLRAVLGDNDKSTPVIETEPEVGMIEN